MSEFASEPVGYAVVEYNQASHLPENLSSTVVHSGIADACWERDLRADEADERGRRQRYVVVALCELEGQDA